MFHQQNQKGVSLMELVLVIAAVGFLVLLIANLPSSISSINKSRHMSLARDITSKEIDSLRKQTYNGLTITTEPVTFSDSSLMDLPTPTATYEISDCPADICPNAEKIKKIKVKVTWKEQGDNKVVELTTLIAEGGLSQ